ncbi:hypothetical protein [Methanolacinia petrolearia]|uniref:hypothetical protein n=1 Tax=Methanolacinia petrolearia TaxID=54120 RepID=UPI003BA8D429
MKKASVNKSTTTNSDDDIKLDSLIIAQTSAVSYTILAIGYIAAASARNNCTRIPPKTRLTIDRYLKYATDHINLIPKTMRIEIILLAQKAVNISNLTTILTNYVNILLPDNPSAKYLEIIVEVFKTTEAGVSPSSGKDINDIKIKKKNRKLKPTKD